MSKNPQRQIQFSIPEPCHVLWNGMRLIDKDQRYCSSCEKVVTDFSKMNDDELMLYFRHNNGKICGRLSQHQLNRPFQVLPEKTTSATWWKTLLLIPLTLFGKSAKAQTNSIPFENHSQDTNALALQPDTSENGFGVKLPEVVENDAVQNDSSKIAVTLMSDSNYKFVWDPKVVWSFPDSLHPIVCDYPMVSGGTVMILNWPIVQPAVVTEDGPYTYPWYVIPSDYGPWESGPEPPKAFEKSFFTYVFDTIFPLRKKKEKASVSQNTTQQIAQPQPYKEVSQQPKPKPQPQPQQPALPASNEITGILPEERKKPWRF